MSNTLSVLQNLARLARRSPGKATASLTDASAAIREALRAQSVYLLYGDDWFRKLGNADDPKEYEVKQEGYWLLNRFMVEKANPCAFNVVNKQVHDMIAARAGAKRSHAAALIPMPVGESDMLIAGGLRGRLRQSDIALLETAAPIVAHLVARQVDAGHSQRQRQQIHALADIARVVAHTQEKEQVLVEIATAVAGVSGFDIVAISVADPCGKLLTHRALNMQRYSNHPVAEAYRNGALDGVILTLAKRGKPVLYADLASDPRISDQVRYLLSGKGLLATMATFPFVFKDEVLGLMSLSSLTPHSLDVAEVELLEGLAAQVAMTLKGLDTYDDLRLSREKLQESTERLQESMSIEYRLARTDPLTGIPNRRYMDEMIAGECARVADGDGSLSLVMADVDDFKEVNDRFGHRFGDDALRLVASLGWQTCRQGEIVGRYGGDEFLFILPSQSVDHALELGEQFRQAVEKATLYAPPGHALGVTVSVGVYQCEAGYLSQPSRLIEMADRAMYRAKSRGGNQVVTLETEPAPDRAG